MNKIKKLLLTCLSLICLATVTMGLVACSKEYELSFNVGGGTQIASVSVKEDKTFALPTPTWNGYEFEGWYLNADYTGGKVTEVKVTKDLTVYAKWTKLYSVTLNVDGGTLSTTTVTLKSGDNVYEAVKNLKPTKTNYVFGAWYNGNVELSKNLKITNSDLTLTAKYQVEYEIEIYTQNETLDGYEKTNTVKHAVNEGVKVYATEKVDGFEEVNNEAAVTELTVTAGQTNVMKQYFDRKEYTVVYNSNYEKYSPSMTNVTETRKGYYGIGQTVLADVFAMDGYYLAGWATTSDGEIAYNTAFVENHLYDKDGTEAAADEISLERNTVLYAVWNKGYTDVFGSSDTIFLSPTDNTVIYLYRGNYFFQGIYDAEENVFMIESPASKEVLLYGKLNENGTYIYEDETRPEVSYGLLQGGKVYASQILKFGRSDDFEYITSEGTTKKTSRGTFVKDGDYYVGTFTEGDRKDTTIVFIVGRAQDSAGNIYNVFIVRNEEEYAMGDILRGVLREGEFATQAGPTGKMVLDGFGNVTFYASETQTASYSYVYSAETKILTLSSSSSTIGTFKILDINGKKAYLPYTKANDVSYDFANGDKLVLDGICFATYTVKGVEKKGTYSVTETPLGNLIEVTSGSVTYKILIKVSIEVVVGADGANTTKTVYTPEEKPATYTSFYYKNADNIWRGPVIALDDEEIGKASIYAYLSTGEYKLALIADYSFNDQTGLYTISNVTDLNVTFEDGVTDNSKITIEEIKNYKTIIFYGDVSTYTMNVWYIDSTVDSGDVTVDNKVRYTGENNEALVFVEGIVFYTKDGNTYNGTYKKSANYTTVTYLKDGSGVTAYFVIDEDAKTFITLQFAPYTAYSYEANGNANTAVTLAFDGRGNATYSVTTVVNEESTVKSYVGKISALEDTALGSGATVYKFTPDNTEESAYGFNYILLSANNRVYFSKYDATLSGEYSSGNTELLLDGFSYYAKYTDEKGVSYANMYVLTEQDGNKVVRMAVDGAYRYFDLKEGKTFTLRGVEYGRYLVIENQNSNQIYVDLDGYLKAKVSKPNADGSATEYIDENATYTISGNIVTVKYTDENKDEVTIVAERSYMSVTISGQAYNVNTLVIMNEERFVTTFVDAENIDVLVLDKLGNAVRYDSKGNKTVGTYTIITGTDTEANGKVTTKGLLYFTDGSRACTFVYDTATHTIVATNNKNEGYYTSNFESLLFTEYGICLMDGQDRYFYEKQGNDCFIYKYDSKNSSANAYGFVKTEFGAMDNEKTYEGKTYYKHDGFAISFNRTDDAENYKLLGSIAPNVLTFIPAGTDEFTVTGNMTLAGRDNQLMSCLVRRIKNADGAYETYIQLNDNVYGLYSFKINISYAGAEASTYSVEGLTYEVSADSASFLNNMYVMLIYYFTGVMPDNEIAAIKMVSTYAQDGTVQGTTLDAEIFAAAGMYDFNGNVIEIKNNTTVKAEGYYNGSAARPIYSAEFKGADGYDYRFYFILEANSTFGRTMFYNYGLVRVETKTDGDFTVELERIVCSDVLGAGGYFSISLKNGEDKYEMSAGSSINGNVVTFVNRKIENNRITSTKYFKVTMHELVVGEEDKKENVVVMPIESVTVSEIKDVVTYQFVSSSNIIIVDIVEGKVNYLYNGEALAIDSTSYSEEDNAHTIVITINNKKITYVLTIADHGVAFLTRKATSNIETDFTNVLTSGDAKYVALSNGKKLVYAGGKTYEVNSEAKTVTETTAVTVNQTEDGKSLVAIEGGNVVYLNYNGATINVKTSAYDEATATYTVTTTVGQNEKTYTIKIEGGVAVITEVTLEA